MRLTSRNIRLWCPSLFSILATCVFILFLISVAGCDSQTVDPLLNSPDWAPQGEQSFNEKFGLKLSLPIEKDEFLDLLRTFDVEPYVGQRDWYETGGEFFCSVILRDIISILSS